MDNKILGMIDTIPASLNDECILMVNDRPIDKLFYSGKAEPIQVGNRFLLNIKGVGYKLVTVTKVYEYILNAGKDVASVRFGYTFEDNTMVQAVKEYVLPLQNFVRYGNTMGCTIDYGEVVRSDLNDTKQIADVVQDYVQRHYNTISLYGETYTFHKAMFIHSTTLGDLSKVMYPDMDNPPAESYYLNKRVCCIFTKKKPVSVNEINVIKLIMYNIYK